MKGGFLVQVGAMVEEGKFRVNKFNRQNNPLWKMQMEDYMYQKDLYLPVGEKRKTTYDYEGWRMGGSSQKRNGNNMDVPGFVVGFEYVKIKYNWRFDERIV